MLSGIWALLCLAFTAAAGDSAAVPGLGKGTWHPIWDAGLELDPATVTAILAVGYLSAAACVGLGLLAVRDGAQLRGRQVLAAGAGAVLAVLVLSALPPTGSADHLSYLAYGRIAASGDDPYVQDPLAWRNGSDPVASAVQPPWQHTPSVYGPVATGLQALVARLGGGDLRLTVWFWQLLMGAAFLLAGLVLDRLSRDDPRGRTRAAVLWTLNPLLLGQLVLGGHLDGLAVAAALCAMALASRMPFVAGLALGVAVGSKITFALFGLAIAFGVVKNLRHSWRTVCWGLLGTAMVLVPAHLWSGPHTYRQLRQTARFVSLATPWRLVADQLDPVYGRPAVRGVVAPVALGVAIVFGAVLVRRIRKIQVEQDAATAHIFRAGVLLAAAWVLTTPYALPWYDGMVWGPVAVLGASALDAILLVRLLVLALAYVPGRVVGMTQQVESLTLGFRRQIVPWFTLAVFIAALVWSCAPQRWLPPAVRRPAAEAPAR